MIEEKEMRRIAIEEKKETRDVNIHYDNKKQIYTIRIPVALARSVNLKEGDKFRLILISKYSEKENKLKNELKGEFIQ